MHAIYSKLCNNAFHHVFSSLLQSSSSSPLYTSCRSPLVFSHTTHYGKPAPPISLSIPPPPSQGRARTFRGTSTRVYGGVFNSSFHPQDQPIARRIYSR